MIPAHADIELLLNSPELKRVGLTYVPIFDLGRRIQSLRLAVFSWPEVPLSAVTTADHVRSVLQLVRDVWLVRDVPVSLGLRSSEGLQAALALDPIPNLTLEIPAFLLQDTAYASAVQAYHQRGGLLALIGRPQCPLESTLLACFTFSIIDLDDDRRSGELLNGGSGPSHQRILPSVQSQVVQEVDVEPCFNRGMLAVSGWPFSGETQWVDESKMSSAARVVMELLVRTERGDDPELLEEVLRKDAQISFRLLRFLNSPAFGLRRPIESLAHAVQLLGYQRLQRWLGLILATCSQDPPAKVALYAAMRRGFFMEALAQETQRLDVASELFMAGQFSLLERVLYQPLAKVVESLPLSDSVRDMLLHRSGVLGPYLDMAIAVEQPTLADVVDAASALMLSPEQVNRAFLRSHIDAMSLQMPT